MGLNGQLGLGFLFEAKDLASGVMHRVQGNLLDVAGTAKESKAQINSAFQGIGVGLSMFGAGALGLAALGPAIQETTDLGKAVALVATETDEATFPQKAMRDEVEKLAVTYGNFPVDEAKALYKAVALGAGDAAKSQSFLNGVNLLAVAGNADLETSANALGGALNAYHASFDEATSYSDAFFTAMRAGNTTVQDLAQAVGRVTATAAGLKIPIDQVLAAVAVMTNQGVKADEAVSGLKEALANVVHPSADAAKEAARLGIKFNQTELRAKGLQGFLKEITSSSKFTASSMSKLFTSVEGSNAILQIVGGNMSFFNDNMDKMANKAGATQAGFEIMTKTLDFQNKKLESNKKVMLGLIGGAIEPLAASVVGLANKLIESFTKLPKPMIEFISKAFAIVSVVLLIGGGIVTAVSAFSLLEFAAGALGVSFASLAAAAGPALLVVGALALGAVVAYELWKKNIGGIQQVVEHAFAKVKLVFEALYQAFTDGGFSGAIRKDLNKAENSGIKQFAINVFVWFGRIKHFFESMAKSFEAGLERSQPLFQQLWDIIGKIADTLGSMLSGPNSPDKAASTFDSFGRAGKTAGDEIVLALQIVTEILVDTLYLIDGVIDGWGYMTDAISPLTEAVNGLFDNLSQLWVMMGFTSNGAVGLGGVMHGLGFVIGGVVKGLVTAMSQMVTLLSTLSDLVLSIVRAVSSVLYPTSSGPNTSAQKGYAGETVPNAIPVSSPAGNKLASPMSMPAAAAQQEMQANIQNQLASFQPTMSSSSPAASGPAPQLHATIMIDSEVVQRVQARMKKNEESRNLSPAPIPE